MPDNGVLRERWRAVEGYEGAYEVSDQGRVRSLSRTVLYRASSVSRSYVRQMRGKVLRPGKYTSSGHVSVILSHGAPGVPVHQLVMRAFVGYPKPKQEVRHLNGVAFDNRLENLCYGTRSDNLRDRALHGARKVTTTQIRKIRKCKGIRGAQAAAAVRYGLSRSQISNIVHRRHYAHVR